MAFKDDRYREQFWSPSGMFIVVACAVGSLGWYVRVLNFATWKHQRYDFPDEASARKYADQWRI